jgi:uncharacterized HAD superfamily protein
MVEILESSKMNKQKAIIVDLDGTLCNVDHRVHFVQGMQKNWKEFNDRMGSDTLYHWCFELITAMKNQGYALLFVTGRDDSYRNLTLSWLKQFQVPFDELHMRKVGDYREDSDVKEEIYKLFIEDKYQILFVVDDRKSVVDRWRKLELTCLQCAPGLF